MGGETVQLAELIPSIEYPNLALRSSADKDGAIKQQAHAGHRLGYPTLKHTIWTTDEQVHCALVGSR